MPISATSIATTDTLETFRSEFNKLVTDVTNLNAGSIDITNLVSTGSIIFEGATADDFETSLTVVDPTADRTITLPNLTGTVSLITATETLTNKTLTSPVLNSGTVGTSLSPTASDGATLGTAALEWSDLFLADGGVINFGDDQDVTLTHVADTGILLSSTDQLQFGDSGTYIHQSADGVLDLVSDTEIEINATTVDINGAVDISGNATIGGDLTITGDDITMGTNTAGHILVADGTNYNPVAVSGDVAISSTGAVTIQADSVEESMMANDAVGQAELKDVVTLTIADSGGTVQKTMYGAGS
tara:strand:- start:6956 stop:7861 length:906 start_codon:yes stop_codon:yes gene_type:complete